MGNWQKVVIESSKVGNLALGSHDYETDLPISGFIGSVTLVATVDKAATSVYTITNAKIIGNETDVLKSMPAILAQRMYNQFDEKKQLATASADNAIMRETDGAISAGLATGDHTPFELVKLNFGRFKGDTKCMLPAFAYQNLKLKWSALVGTAALDAAEVFEVVCNVYVPSPNELSGQTVFILKDTEIKKETYTETSGFKDITLPLGNFLRRAMVFVESGLADVSALELRLNNGAEVPLSDRFGVSTIDDMTEYHLVTQDTHCTMMDFDLAGDLSKCINLAAYNDAKIRLTLAGAGTYSVVMSEVVPVKLQ